MTRSSGPVACQSGNPTLGRCVISRLTPVRCAGQTNSRISADEHSVAYSKEKYIGKGNKTRYHLLNERRLPRTRILITAKDFNGLLQTAKRYNTL